QAKTKMAGHRRRAFPCARLTLHMKLLPDSEAPNEFGVAVRILALEIVEESASLADQLQKASPGMMVLRMYLEMLGQVIDALAQERHLNFRRSCVGVVGSIRSDDAGLTVLGQRHG